MKVEEVAQRGCGYPIPDGVQGQVRCVIEQRDLVRGEHMSDNITLLIFSYQILKFLCQETFWSMELQNPLQHAEMCHRCLHGL